MMGQTLKPFTFTSIINKLSLFLSIVFVLFAVCTTSIAAQVVINEFSSFENSGDWIELYNTSGADQIDLKNWSIKDTASTVVHEFTETTLLPPNGYCKVDAGNRLNKDGDRIELFRNTQTIDCVSYGNTDTFCAGKSDKDVDSPETGKVAARSPNGTGNFQLLAGTLGYSNDETIPPANLVSCIVKTPEPSPTSTPSPSPTPSPTLSSPTRAPTASPSPKPTPNKTATPIPSETTKPTSVSTSTPEPEVLGTTQESNNSVSPLAYGFIGIGTILTGAAIAPIVKKEYTKRTRDNSPENIS